ncbi:MAG: hypothetical protein GDA36_06035 [Rhodobacteraceae bacterium]|nr:hypothetical protein [Paracoccaceae bacterium]
MQKPFGVFDRHSSDFANFMKLQARKADMFWKEATKILIIYCIVPQMTRH